jgi:hypothetical protein
MTYGMETEVWKSPPVHEKYKKWQGTKIDDVDDNNMFYEYNISENK